MKNLIAFLLVLIMTLTTALSISTNASADLKGDINGDGNIDNKDVVALFRYVSAAKKAEDDSMYDFDGDGEVTNKDVIALFRDLSYIKKTDYEIFLYGNGEGGSADNATERYTGKDLFMSHETKKSNMDKKQVVLFGYEHELYYSSSLGFTLWDDVYDEYDAQDGLFLLSEKTGKLVAYAAYTYKKGEDYKSKVDAHSTRQEFIDYAKDVLLEYCGTDTTDYKAEISTRNLKTKYHYTEEERAVDFVNFADKDTDFSAEYLIVFRKMFNGIYNPDRLEVVINSNGEVLDMRNYIYENFNEKFKDVEIDTKRISDIVEDSFNHVMVPGMIVSKKITLTAVPDGDELWVSADVDFDYADYDYEGNEFISGGLVKYLIKVSGSQTEPVDTEDISELESEFESEAISEDESEDESVFESEESE